MKYKNMTPDQFQALMQQKYNRKGEIKRGEVRLDMIQQILEEHQVLLNNFNPDWKDVMTASGWDNSINRMYSKYRANIQVSLTNHIPKLLGKYLDKVEMANDITLRNVNYVTRASSV